MNEAIVTNDLRIILSARTEVEKPNNIKAIYMVWYVDSSAMHNLLCVGWMLWKNNLLQSVLPLHKLDREKSVLVN